jgi:hypothetical protein
MPVRVEYTEDGIGVVLRHEGVATGRELYSSVSLVYNDKRYTNLKYWIGDRTDCTQFLPDYEWQKKIVGLNRKESSRNPGMLLALVSPKDLTFGMSRMFQTISEGDLFKTEVFRDRDSAEKWIKEELSAAK